jgi:hypothetical protein
MGPAALANTSVNIAWPSIFAVNLVIRAQIPTALPLYFLMNRSP